MSNSSGAPLGVRDLAELLNTTPERLEAIRDRYFAEKDKWGTLEQWYKNVRGWHTNTPRDAIWEGLPDDAEELLKKSYVKKRSRVVRMSEGEQLARHAAAINGQGNQNKWRTRGLREVYPEIQEICGKVPHLTATKWDRDGEPIGSLSPQGRVAFRQLQLCKYLDPDARFTISELNWLANEQYRD